MVSFEVNTAEVHPYRIELLHCHGLFRQTIPLLRLNLNQLHLILINHVEDFRVIGELGVELLV